MMNDFIDTLAQKICQKMPESLKGASDDVKAQVKSCVHSALKSMDIVTRDEFDTQVKVLEKTRQKLDELEKKLK
jgi:ubiquinone biosynthesis accessory factor UbiK